ncbi:MAG: Gfo/Idh/MocA family oxidoreductase [Kiritimatiellae bacterium]|nr:Gfo/Idh/MocA family oxidoreductase [Kiritimatiellia bacterium]
MKQIKVGIIGQGRSGRNIHAAHLLRDTQRYKIVAIADELADRRQRAAAELRCETFADYHDLFKKRDLDLIVNATFSCCHPAVSIEVLEAGFNVLCEKPMASTVKDVDRMIAASKKSGKLLAVFQQSRFAPALQQIQQLIESGVLGRIVQISMAYNGFGRRWDWQTMQERWGGNLMNTGPHPLDQALYLFGEGMPDVRCYMDRTDNTLGDAEDYVKVILSGAQKPVIDIEISSCCAYPCFTYNLQGTRGGLKGSTTNLEWKYFKLEEAPLQKLGAAPLCKIDGTPSYCNEELKWHAGAWAFDPTKAAGSTYLNSANDLMPAKGGPAASSDLFAAMAASYYTMLYKTLAEGQPLQITPEQVRRQVAVFELCRAQNPHVYASAPRAKAAAKKAKRS